MANFAESFIRGKPAKRKVASVDNGVEDLAAPPTEPKGDFLFSMRSSKRQRGENGEARGTANKKTMKKKAAKARKRQQALEERQKELFGSAPGSVNLPRRIELLSFSRLSLGLKLMGVVRQVNAKSVVLSLPNSLTGHLDVRDISDFVHELPAKVVHQVDLRKLFKAGQYLLCAVSNLDESDRKKIDVTTRASVVNEGMVLEDFGPGLIPHVTVHVQSVEDHGFVVSLGVQRITGFLAFTDIATDGSDRDKEDMFSVGQPLVVNVKSVSTEARSVNCMVSGEAFPMEPIANSASVSLTSLMPGMVVKATIKRVYSSGLYTTFLTSYGGSLDVYHLKKPASAGWVERKVYNVGDTIMSRVTVVDTVAKSVCLSSAPHILSLIPKEFECEKGDLFKKSIVARVDGGVGLLLNCTKQKGEDSEEEGSEEITKRAVAYVHISRVSDERTDSLSRHKGKTVSCRIVGFSEFDGMALASMKKSTIAAEILAITDLKPGMLIPATVEKVNAKSVLCILGENVRGVILPMHVAEVMLTNFGEKFVVGSQIQVRVLQVDAKRRRALLTHKRTLLKSTNSIITNYTVAHVGGLAHGFVTAIKEYGVVVTFYNNVHGLVAIEDLERHGIDEPEQAYNIGQAVLCRVLSVQPNNNRMRLSFHTKGELMLDLPDALQVGNIVKSSKIDKINGNGEAIFNLGENVRGVLNSFQMSDHPEHSDALFGKLKAGDAVENMLVLDTCKIFTRGGLPSWKIVLSVKPALIAALENGKLPKSLDDAEVDDIFCGYVHNTTAHGAFLRFLGRSTAYVPKANISDRFVVSPSDFVHRGQTMWVKIVRPSSNPGESPIGTVRPSQCCPWNVPHEEQNLYLRTLLEEDEATAEQNTAQKDDSEDEGEETGHWSDFTVGMVVKGMVLKQSAKGFLLKIDGGMAGFCINANAPKNEYAKGAQCKCLVLNIDKENNALHVSLDPSHIHKKSKSSSKYKVGTQVSGVVLLEKSRYYVVQLAPKNKLNSIGFLSKVSYNGPNEFLKSLSIGKEVTAVVSGYCSKSTTTLPKKTPLLVFPEEVFVKPRSNSVISNSSDDDSTLKRGSVVEGVISDITRTSVKVTLATNPQSHTNVLASVFLTDLIDLNEDNSKKNVLLHMRSLDIGTKITAKCLWVADQSISGNTIAQLTTRPSELESSSLAKRYSWKDISQILTSKQIFGVVLEILETGAWVAISPTLKGFVYATNCSHDDDIDLLNDQGVAGVLQLGQVVACKVLSFDNDQHHLELSLRASDLLTEASNAYPVGSIVVGQALALNSRSRLKVSNAPAINLQVSKNSYGRVCVTHLTDRDHWVDVPFGRKTSKKEKKGMDSILPGKFVRCCVLSHKNGQLDLSMRSSLVFAAEKNSGGSGTKWLDNLLKSDDLDQFKSGDITKGYVVKTVKQGCFVRMSPSVIARVMISNLSDSFIKHADKVFYPSKLVVGKILTLDTKSRRMELTLKNSAVKVRKEKPEEAGRLTFNSIKVDQILEATVSKVESYGVFVKFINSGTPGISALCHISEATDKFVKKLSKLFSVGDLVKSKVVKIDRKSKNISISLKPSNFADIEEGDDTPDAPKGEHVGFSSSSEEEDGSSSDDGSDSEEDDSGDEEPSVSGNKFEKTDSSVAKEASGSESSDSDSSSNSDSDEGSDMETESSEKKTSGFSFKGFQGFAGLGKRDSDSESSDSESDSDGEGNKRKKARSSRKKARSRRQEEAAIVAQEEALLDGNVIPESVSDFERLVISSPNSSFAWIKYMAFQLSLTEIDLARGIAERALKKINYREGEEKLNVWLAYLNLEYKYGVDSTFNTLFKRAVQVNDPITIYLRMAKIYTEGGDAERAMSMYTRAMKKYGSKSTALYADYGLFAIQTGNKYIQFRSILGEALKRLPDREHISLITKFAIMEFKHGSAERGRTIFEEVVGNYPKRVDVWNMYLDQEVSLNTASGDIKRVRKLFDRVVSMKFSSKKMKFLFKKYLQFEQVNGTADGEEKVKDLARSWVESQ